MSARYVYFRTPEGKPDRSTDAGNAPRNLLGLLGRNSRLNDKGQIEYPGSEMIRFNVALESAVVVLGPDGVELNEHDTNQVLWRGLKAVGRKAPGSPINPVELLREADRAAAEFYRLPPVGYTLVASLSVARFPAKSIGIGGCSVAPIRGRTEYGVPDALDSPAREALAAHLRSTGYQFVRVATEGRSVFEAVDRGTNALGLLRGLWSLFATFGTWTIFSQPQRRPLGVIHAGPLYTLHHPDKRAAIENRYWFEPDYIADRPLFSPKADNWQKIEKNRRWATRRLARLGYRADLERLLVRYADALDQPNQDLAFLQMWSILEKLTSTA